MTSCLLSHLISTFGVAFFAVSACRFPRAQTVVEVRADTRIARETSETRIEVRNQLGAEIFVRTMYPQGSELGHAMAYDSQLNRVVLFGGGTSGTSDTWILRWPDTTAV